MFTVSPLLRSTPGGWGGGQDHHHHHHHIIIIFIYICISVYNEERKIHFISTYGHFFSTGILFFLQIEHFFQQNSPVTG